MNKVFISLIVLLTSISSHAAPSAFNGTIKQVVCHAKEISSICHLSVNGTPTEQPCGAGGWPYSFIGTNAEGKNLLSILLAAQLSNSHVTIGGQGTCNIIGGSEDLRHVYINTIE